jgi:hypothetical protein
MTLIITDNIPNLQLSPTCKQFLQVYFHRAKLRYESEGTAEVAKAWTFSEYEKYNAARLEREVSQIEDDFDNVVQNLKTKNGGKE